MGALVRALPRPRISLPQSLPAWPVLKRRLLLALTVAAALAAGYHFWLRDSSLVAVEQVTVVGADQSPEIDRKLRAAGLGQTTLHIDQGALSEAVAGEPAVRSVTASGDFPHGLTIEVELRNPAGFVRSEGLVVAGDGVILERTGSAPQGLPAIKAESDKGAAGSASAVGGEALEVARVLGSAPEPLAPLIASATTDETMGVVVELSAGLELRFGGAGDAATKWLAAAAVLADPSFETAAYLDLSVPDRPVAGGVPDAPADAPVVDPAADVAAAAEAAVLPDATVAPEAAAEPEPVPIVPEEAVP
jgi:cell division septal protein FtsQ